MTNDSLIDRIRELEDELEKTIDEQRKRFHYQVHERRVRFEQAIKNRHRRLKTSIFRYLASSGILAVAFAPLVCALIVPLVLLDVFVSIYQFVCYPVNGIKKVKRSDFIAIDRQHLAYLNAIEKLNCAYCGYANGLLAYAREIAGRSEEHWCPIKHARRTYGQHGHYWAFAEYGDADGFSKRQQENASRSFYRPEQSQEEDNPKTDNDR